MWQDKGHATLPARLAINALASVEHADTVTADLGAQHARREAAAQVNQAPNGPPGMPGDAARVRYPQPHQGGGGGLPPPGGPPDHPIKERKNHITAILLNRTGATDIYTFN